MGIAKALSGAGLGKRFVARASCPLCLVRLAPAPRGRDAHATAGRRPRYL